MVHSSGTQVNFWIFATPKLTSEELGGPVDGLFKDLSKDLTCPKFPGLTFGQWKFIFNY